MMLNFPHLTQNEEEVRQDRSHKRCCHDNIEALFQGRDREDHLYNVAECGV